MSRSVPFDSKRICESCGKNGAFDFMGDGNSVLRAPFPGIAVSSEQKQWGVAEYCTEEVRRQGHDVYSRDGIERVGWMLNAWSAALEWQEEDEPLDAESLGIIRDFGRLVEPIKNSGGFRIVGVRVGQRVCPPPGEVRDRLKRLLALLPMDAMEFYREFELIHPFVDGNGRTGKILLNWLNGTLLNPIFPPNDFWGEPILNP